MNKAERTRQFIIEASAPIMNKQGMAGTSISDIMEATKLAKGGIYGNFESKDEICLESFSYLYGQLSDGLDHAVRQGRTAEEKLSNLLNYHKNRDPAAGGCPILNFGVESDDTHPQMKERVKNAIRTSQKRIFNIIAEGIRNQELSPEMDASHFSIKIFSLIEGAVLCRKVMGSDEQLNIIHDSIRKEFADYLI